MEAVVRKLAHPIEEIRVRALHTIETKVTRGLWPAPMALPQALRSMLADSLPALAVDYPQAATLLQQLNAPAPATRPRATLGSLKLAPAQPQEDVKEAPALAEPPTDTARGWTFPPVVLAEADDKLLFELEVKLKLQARPMDVLSVVRRLRDSAIIDFPPEVFLQRPATLQYLLHLVATPLLEPSAGFGDVYYDYPKTSTPATLLLTVLDVLCDLTAGWLQSCRLLAHATYTAPSSPHQTSRYPSPAGAPVVGSWSLAGGLHEVVVHWLVALAQPTAPQVHLVAAVVAVAPAWLRDADDIGLDARRFTRLFHAIANVLLAPHVDKHVVTPLVRWVTDVFKQLTPSELHPSVITVPDRLVDELASHVLVTGDEQLLPYVVACRPEVALTMARHVRFSALQKKCDPFLASVSARLDGSTSTWDAASAVATARELLDLVVADDGRRESLLGAIAHVIGLAADEPDLSLAVQELVEALGQRCVEVNGHYETVLAYVEGPLGGLLTAQGILHGLCQRLAVDPAAEALWTLLDGCWTRLGSDIPPVMWPYLQHWAYAEVPISRHHGDVQESWARLLHALPAVAMADDVVLRLRCLFHRSNYVRRAAVMGLNEILSLAVDDDVFGGDDTEPALQAYARAHHSGRLGHASSSQLVEKVHMWLLMLRSTSLEANIKASVLTQAAERLYRVGGATDVLADAGLLAELLPTLVQLLDDASAWMAPKVVLVLDRLLSQSSFARKWFRAQVDGLRALFLCANVETNPELRAGAYCCLAYITMARDVWTLEEDYVTSMPSMLLPTFGLHASVWTSIDSLCPTPLLASAPASPLPLQRPMAAEWTPTHVRAHLEALASASSHRSYLHLLYNLRWWLVLDPTVWAPVVDSHGQHLLRLLETYPCSAKDLLVLAALLRCFASVTPHLGSSLLLTLLLRLKVHVAPLLRQCLASNAPLFDATMGLLLAMAEASVDLARFVAAFLIDTNVHATALLTVGVAVDAAVALPVQRVCLRLVARLTQVAGVDAEAWHRFASETLRPVLLSVLRPHRRADSFQDKRRVLHALECLLALPTDDDVVATARSVLFDVDGRLRTLGYMLVASGAETEASLAQLALDTVGDATEAAAVRRAAGAVVARASALYTAPVRKLLVDETTTLAPALTLALLRLVPLNDPSLPSLPWPLLLSMATPVDVCSRFAHSVLGLSETKRSAFRDLITEAWTTSHQADAMLSVRTASFLLLSVAPRPSVASLLPAVSSVLVWSGPLDAHYTALLGDVLSVLSVLLAESSLHLPASFLSELLEALLRATSDRFADRALLERLLAPMAALLPRMLPLLLPQQTTKLSTLSDHVVALLVHTEVAPAPLASILTSIAESGEVPMAPTHNLVAVAWRRLLVAADTMRLRGVSASDSFVLYASLLAGLFFTSKSAQDDATALELPRHVANFYSTICKPTVHAPVASSALALLINYVRANDSSKRATIAQGAFYAQLWETALARNGASPQVFSLLKALVLHADGVLAAIKRGFLAKAVASLDETLRQIAKGNKTISIAAVGPLVDVLANVASVEDGRAELGSSTRLHVIFADLLAAPSVLQTTTRWVRHMACAPMGKNALIQWQSVLAALVALVAAPDVIVALHASCAVWWLLYNNQRALALLQTNAEWSATLRDAATSAATRLDSDAHRVVEYQLRNIVQLLDDRDDRDDRDGLVAS
ncbi:hypothetical protein SDRG_11758 [Saprolegnia diclina VS20]|uniref:Uncharacterized protein n=1 Tax=Saprolegnia diclina (strain VS20) TaxID=1156394 RepID=T0PY27_SAPDV|nr:hypothetical protein SDRG_11758 [Saprolegnia diclina VS20]EQC30439.1 hypothetical protein SDRG_11758 [Saprolegnia diclina VS20]|eukprot:XP_008616032.1 hypothetical protein SDRG_11758 [Saprolegnia diclina VS20]